MSSARDATAPEPRRGESSREDRESLPELRAGGTMAAAFQWSLAALETLMAEDQLGGIGLRRAVTARVHVVEDFS